MSSKKKDQDYTFCTKCDSGTYRQMTINDKIDATLHCDNPNCWHKIDRWIEVEDIDLSEALKD